MFKFKREDENSVFLYLEPDNENTGKWEIIDEQELEHRIENNTLNEGCRLFKIEKEIKVSFERVTHLD